MVRMKVCIKDFAVGMEVKSKGIELEVREPGGKFLGDLVVTNTRLIWCKGRTGRENAKEMRLEKFIEMMEGDH